MASLSSLIGARRFAPMLACSCTGAFNDNYFKNALIILLTYRIADADHISAETLISIASALFILPFFLFSGIAGNLADHMPKHRLVYWLKLTELALCALALPALLISHIWSLMLILTLLGIQSAFFGPVKYAILPSLLEPDELIAGNGITEAGTFLAILFGTMLGGLLILHDSGPWIVGCSMLLIACAGVYASRSIPALDPAHPAVRIRFNVWRTTIDMLRSAAANNRILCAILGISWFWAIGSTYLTQLPAFTKQVLGGNEHIVTFFFALFSIGIGVGSLLCNRLLKGEVKMTYVPWAMGGVALFGLDIWFFGHSYPAPEGELTGLLAFLGHAVHWRLVADLWALAICGGLFIVPLYTLLQAESAAEERARVIASNNVVNALIIAMAAAAAAAAYGIGLHVRDVFLTAALLNIPVIWALWRYVK